ncbi:MAG: hypothetical protein Q8O12_06085 [Candidatus Omnitrophota bacterium]|nr:hypothetical protein [Candidatus Omnitrophota bacterium]
MNKTRFLVLIACLLALSAGCVTLPKDESVDGEKNAAPLSVAPILKFEDIPVPAGFKLLDKESFAFQNDKSRVALLKYYGGKNSENVIMFYKEQMAAFNWSLVNIIEYERKVMNYENSEESCIITIQPQGGKSLITVALSPKSRPMKPEKSSSREYK